MIYLDNAATTYPKPMSVYRAWSTSLRSYGANPGRAGHILAERTAEAVFSSRLKCAELFGAEPENTIFTLNCTHALNMAIKGVAAKGCHFVASDLEHNAAIRPIYAAAQHYGGGYTIFRTAEDDRLTLANAERAIRPETVAMICTAASNVTGRRPPIRELAQLCRERNICFIVDAAQGAGVLPLELSDGINILCCAGHKGLYGPMGTGLLLTDCRYHLDTIIEGGTGSLSESLKQPDFLPDRLESGTIATPSVVTLGAGVDFVRQRGIPNIYRHEMQLCLHFVKEARHYPNIVLYTDLCPENSDCYAPVVPFNIRGLPSSEASVLLSRNGFCLRGGLHCAPLAHEKLGTSDAGTLRLSPSVFNTHTDISRLLWYISTIKT